MYLIILFNIDNFVFCCSPDLMWDAASISGLLSDVVLNRSKTNSTTKGQVS
jgi:hypothetical protein